MAARSSSQGHYSSGRAIYQKSPVPAHSAVALLLGLRMREDTYRRH